MGTTTQKGIASRAGVATSAQARAGVGPGTTGPGDPAGPGDARPTPPGLPPAARARVRDALMTLEYPRQLHKAGDEHLRVENEEEARAAMADGWCLSPDSPRLTEAGPDPDPDPDPDLPE